GSGALPADLRWVLDYAASTVQVVGLTEFHTKNSIALERLRTEFKGKVEVLQLPVPVLRDLRKLAAQVVREESEKTPMARKVSLSFAKFQELVMPWDHVAEGAYRHLIAAGPPDDGRSGPFDVLQRRSSEKWRPPPARGCRAPPASSRTKHSCRAKVTCLRPESMRCPVTRRSSWSRPRSIFRR